MTSTWEALPVHISGAWGTSQSSDVAAVLASVLRDGANGIPADRAPSRLDLVGDPNHHCPHIIAIDTPDRAAAIKLTVIDRRWAQLAYQFGHELGHVLANSWGSKCLPLPPSHWLEEALVEAFSVYSLQKMGQAWIISPPFPNWASYAPELANYAQDRLKHLDEAAEQSGFNEDPSGWYAKTSLTLEPLINLQEPVWPMIPSIVQMFSDEPGLLADLTFLNTWPERGTIPMRPYLDAWQKSCTASPAGGYLPRQIQSKLGLA